MNKCPVLIVDDDASFLKVAGTILERKGYEIRRAASGSEALAALHESPFAVVILDINLPDKKGTDMLPEVVKLYPELSVIMLTGHATLQNAVTSLNNGAFAYLEKPVHPDYLVSVLHRAAEKYDLLLRNKQLSAQLEEKHRAKALRELDYLRTELLANVSHELRTPLAAIKGYSSALLQPDVTFDQETLREFLQTIDREANRLNRIIEDLLIMSRLDSGTWELKKKQGNISEVVNGIKDNLFNLTTKHKLQVLVPDDLPVIMLDERIGYVFTNLVENAVKYSPEGTNITVRGVKRGDDILISIQDEGKGIPAELEEKIFERFYQIVDPVNGHKSGTGLGLSICKGIVSQHGGKIWVESSPGNGSKFCFTLPCTEAVLE
jgi:two-component system, OmpR family, sensor histidine kinase KdpD